MARSIRQDHLFENAEGTAVYSDQMMVLPIKVQDGSRTNQSATNSHENRLTFQSGEPLFQIADPADRKRLLTDLAELQRGLHRRAGHGSRRESGGHCCASMRPALKWLPSSTFLTW